MQSQQCTSKAPRKFRPAPASYGCITTGENKNKRGSKASSKHADVRLSPHSNSTAARPKNHRRPESLRAPRHPLRNGMRSLGRGSAGDARERWLCARPDGRPHSRWKGFQMDESAATRATRLLSGASVAAFSAARLRAVAEGTLSMKRWAQPSSIRDRASALPRPRLCR